MTFASHNGNWTSIVQSALKSSDPPICHTCEMGDSSGDSGSLLFFDQWVGFNVAPCVFLRNGYQWDKTSSQLARSERSKKYNHLKPSLQKQHPLLDWFKFLYFCCL